jgi:hypothetical protein
LAKEIEAATIEFCGTWTRVSVPNSWRKGPTIRRALANSFSGDIEKAVECCARGKLVGNIKITKEEFTDFLKQEKFRKSQEDLMQ